jgi:hypothetical protein
LRACTSVDQVIDDVLLQRAAGKALGAVNAGSEDKQSLRRGCAEVCAVYAERFAPGPACADAIDCTPPGTFGGEAIEALACTEVIRGKVLEELLI